MEPQNTIALDGDLLRRARLSSRYTQRAVAVKVNIGIAQYRALEESGRCNRLSLQTLFRVAETVGVDASSLIRRRGGNHEPHPDDVIVEAALAAAGKLVNSTDLAWGLGWRLERVQAALDALEERLLRTGQRLRRGKYGWYGLRAANDLLDESQSAAIERASLSEFGLKRAHASVLKTLEREGHLANAQTAAGVSGWQMATAQLLRAGLIVYDHDRVVMSSDLAFSLCLEDLPTAASVPVQPQTRALRTPYSVNYAAPKRRGRALPPAARDKRKKFVAGDGVSE